MAKYLMVQGTTSNAGKSTVVAGLIRILAQDGYKVAPFKAQNMGLNSFYDSENKQMGYAQAIQAYAAYIKPQAIMNPILLKPKQKSQIDVMFNGVLDKTMSGKEYNQLKDQYLLKAYESLNILEKDYDIIVIEGAGSPAEINMHKPDIANMGLAKLIQAPILMVGNIELGGVFASLYGTYQLVEADERKLIQGFIINKLHGYAQLLDSGIKQLEDKLDTKSYGVIEYLELDLEDEDIAKYDKHKPKAKYQVGIVKSNYSSNLNVFKALDLYQEINIRIINRKDDVSNCDLLLIPSSNDLEYDSQFYKEIDYQDKKLVVYGNTKDCFKHLENEIMYIKDNEFNLELDNIIKLLSDNPLEIDHNIDRQRDHELDKLAAHLRKNLDLKAIYELLERQ